MVSIPLPRAMSSRGLAVAIGVPVAFAIVAFGLGSPLGAAQAAVVADQPAAQSAAQVAGQVAGQAAGQALAGAQAYVPVHDYSVRRMAVVDPRRLVHRDSTVQTDDKVAFITIDDGIVKDRRGLAFVQRRHLPVTAFLSTWTIKDQAPYFRSITQWGSIQNHSATHADFTRASTDLDHEVCYSQRMLKRTFGTRPTLLRPPFGAGSEDRAVLRKALECGVTDVVLWDAYVYKGRLATTGKLQPGSIVLLHFSKHLARDLSVAAAAIHRAGLSPASLADYLPAAR
mgnify:FL=1